VKANDASRIAVEKLGDHSISLEPSIEILSFTGLDKHVGEIGTSKPGPALNWRLAEVACE
jgi:hypothetical protein